jgi:ATP-dependent DNA ligase
VPFRLGSSHRAFRPKPIECPPAANRLHEIKNDGFRIIARKYGSRVRLYGHPGNDFTHRFPLIVETMTRLRSLSCIIDGEAVACDEAGMSNFVRKVYFSHSEGLQCS